MLITHGKILHVLMGLVAIKLEENLRNSLNKTTKGGKKMMRKKSEFLLTIDITKNTLCSRRPNYRGYNCTELTL